MDILRGIRESRQVLAFDDTVFQKVKLFDHEASTWEDSRETVAAPSGGPVMTLTSSGVHFRTASGRHISSLEWGRGLLAAYGWTHVHDAVFVLVTGERAFVK